MKRVLEGRLIMTPRQVSGICKRLGATVDDLLKTKDDFVSYGYCFGSFRDKNNEEKIMNIIDDYIDIIESVGVQNG